MKHGAHKVRDAGMKCWGVPRHSTRLRNTASDVLERALETRVRQEGQAACEEGWLDYVEMEDVAD
jgi:hypothetical protein